MKIVPDQPTILYNARIYTLNQKIPFAESIAIRNEQVIACGRNEEVAELAGPDTRLLNLNGKTVLPGLTDAHIHLESYAQSLDLIDCETETLAVCLDRVREKAGRTPVGEWIRGHGWNQNAWGSFGSATDLDRVAPVHPVYLTAKSLHAAWVNGRALETAGIDASTPDPPGGEILRKSDGSPTGILLEEAMLLVKSVIPAVTIEDLVSSLKEAQKRLWAYGITGVHDFDGPQCFRALQVLREAGSLGLRVLKNIPLRHLQDALGLGLRSGFGDAWIRIGNIKVFADGALGPRTAAMLAPYETEPDNTGISLVDAEELLEISARAGEGGLAMSVHAIGDRANHEVLNAYEALRAYERDNGLPPLRHRVEHLQLLHRKDLLRPGSLGLVASMQPIHATSDMLMADRYWGERVKTSYAWRSLSQSGALLAFGSDAPVESPNPFWGIHAALTRRRRDGYPGTEGWIPEERIGLEDALRAYTLGPAFAAGLEKRLGQLSPGMLADLIVLEVDPFACSPEEIADLRPVGTMVGGRWHRRAFQ